MLCWDRYTCDVLQVESRSEEAQVVQACLACHGSSPHTSTRDRHLEDPNVMLAGAYSGKLQLGPFLCYCCVFVSAWLVCINMLVLDLV